METTETEVVTPAEETMTTGETVVPETNEAVVDTVATSTTTTVTTPDAATN
ncbi:hypothetical protein [Cruoricaptor ignavus]|uniref:hypothetical protein n=1 Tax=Cruoricaptor ignavus TaxID=1118202 RepID=UPI0013566EA1|nr:hypothetical protein [Cruoricaptor ignavus]